MLGAVALLALLVPVLAGCSSKTASAGDSVRRASRESSSAQSVSFEMTIQMEGVMGQDVEMEADGVYDLAKRQMQMTMGILGMEMEAVMDGSTMFVKMPLLGEDWYKSEVDLADAASSPLGAGFQDPTQALKWLEAAGNDVEDLGEDEVRGDKARHFRTMLDLREAARQLDDEHREQVEAAIEQLGTAEMPVDLWVNEDGLPVKLEYAMSFEESGIAELDGAKMTFVMEYFDWGKPVRVDVPDASQAKDLEEAFGGLFGG